MSFVENQIPKSPQNPTPKERRPSKLFDIRDCNWASITINIAGVEITGIKAIDFNGPL
jgi:hypothetical protein